MAVCYSAQTFRGCTVGKIILVVDDDPDVVKIVELWRHYFHLTASLAHFIMLDNGCRTNYHKPQ